MAAWGRPGRPRALSQRAATVAVTLSAALLALSLGAARAGAVVAKIGGHGYGVTPINGVSAGSLVATYRAQRASRVSAAPLARSFDELPLGGTPLVSEGGPVMHSATTHVIYWDPGGEFTATTKGIVDNFFTNVEHDSGLASNVFAVAGQYKDATGHAAYSSSFGGALEDKGSYPSTFNCTVPTGVGVDAGPPYTKCLLDSQLQSELSSYITAHSLPKGPTQLYFLLLPHKVATCFNETAKEELEFGKICSNNFFCAYHGYIAPGTANEIIYADIPFSLLDSTFAKGCQDDGNKALQQPNPDNAGGKDTETRFADVALKYISHEYIEATTDPLVNNKTAWVDANGLEIGDKCNGVTPNEAENGIAYDENAFLPVLGGTAGAGGLFNQAISTGSYYLQSEWDNVGEACLMRPLPLEEASFTSSSAPAQGEPVEFSGEVTDPYEDPEFAWEFGDGSMGTGPSPSHIYAAAGEYTVKMTVKDGLTGSTTTPVEEAIVVDELPSASFTIVPQPAPMKTVVRFDGSGSADADGSITAYKWEFGDGAVGSGPEATHEYVAPGTYSVTLTVTDSSELTGATTHSVTVTAKPTVLTGAASSLSQISATLNATVNPNGVNVEECKFEYGTTVFYESTVLCSALPGSGASPIAVATSLTGLAPNTAYHFRIVAQNSAGSSAGADQTLTTLANPTPPGGGASSGGSLTTGTLATAIPNGAFGNSATFNARTGAIAFKASVLDPGTLSWLATFQNGNFGVFAASTSKCKKGFVRLNGRCRAAKIVFARGSKSVTAPGSVTFTLKPSASALKALKNALKHKKGLPVAVTLTFQSSRGGSPVSNTRLLTVRLKK